MNATLPNLERDPNPSAAAQRRLLAVPGEPLFNCDWVQAVFIHYEIEPELLQAHVPFPLDTRSGKAYVSLVAFTMRDLRPCRGGKTAAWLFAPIATHELLNVRTYVRHGDETGIYFLAEWIPNRLSAWIGPRTFGLPYRLGRLEYQHQHEDCVLRGTVTAGSSRLSYEAKSDPGAGLHPVASNSLDEFLMERYTAFTKCGLRQKFFRIWHAPWLQQPVEVQILDDSLIAQNFAWFAGARQVGANYAPRLANVWMGWPHRVINDQFARLRLLRRELTMFG